MKDQERSCEDVAFLERVMRFQDGSLSADEVATLEREMRTSPEKRRLFAEAQMRAVFLREAFRKEAYELPQRRERTVRPLWFGWRPLAAALAAVLLVVAATMLLTRQRGQPVAELPPAVPTDRVATLVFVADCQWENGADLREGQRLAAGDLQLRQGMAVVRFDGGASAILVDQVNLNLLSRGSTDLRQGKVVVRVPAEAAGFIVRTPACEVIDVGTEFAAYVEPPGATDIHVLEGKVALGRLGMPPAQRKLLEAGKAVRFDRSDSPEPREVPLDAPRFNELLSRAAKPAPAVDLSLAWDSFSYPLGALPSDQASGGGGWDGPWQILLPGWESAPQPATLNIGVENLSRAWPGAGESGPALRWPESRSLLARRLAAPVRLDRDGVWYLSLMVRREGSGADPVGPSVILRDSRQANHDRLIFQLGSTGAPLISVREGIRFANPLAVAPGRTQFWVAKIVARSEGEDEVSFRIYAEGEPLDELEPAQWYVRSEGFHSYAQLDMLVLTGIGNGRCWFDEVRIGTKWRSAVLPDQKGTER